MAGARIVERETATKGMQPADHGLGLHAIAQRGAFGDFEHKLAEIDLAATEIRAPISGVVGDLAARLGSRVPVGGRLMAIVPLDSVFIEANFKETQLAAMKVGQKAAIELDAFPGLELTGSIQSLSPASGAEFALLPPDNASGNFNKIVQRVPVKIVLDGGNAEGRLRPGMSAGVTVETR